MSTEDRIEGIFRTQALEAGVLSIDEDTPVTLVPPWTWNVLAVGAVAIVTALVMSFVARVEVIARARGVVQPAAGVRVLRAPASGRIHDVLVSPGRNVPAGEPIVSIDVPQSEGVLLEARRQLEFLERVQSHDEETRFDAQMQSTRQRVAQVAEQIDSLNRSLAGAERVCAAQEQLLRSGLASAMDVDRAREVREQVRRQLSAAREAQLTAQQDLVELDRRKGAWERERDSALNSARAHVSALEVPKRSFDLVAPISGRVEGLVAKPGDIVDSAQELGKLIPAQSRLQVTAFVAEKDRALIAPGSIERVELDRYPYSEFGTIPARVVAVSEERASVHELVDAFGDEGRASGAVCRVDLEVMPRENGQPLQLMSGMLVTVRFTLRKERPIRLLWEPARRLFG